MRDGTVPESETYFGVCQQNQCIWLIWRTFQSLMQNLNAVWKIVVIDDQAQPDEDTRGFLIGVGEDGLLKSGFAFLEVCLR